MPDDVASTTTMIDWITKASLATLLIGVLVLGQMGVWVWGTQLAEAKKDRDEWKALALKAAKLVDDPAVRPIGMAPPAPEVEILKRDVNAKLEAAE